MADCWRLDHLCNTMTHSAFSTHLQRETAADPFAGSRYQAIQLLTSGETGTLYVVEHIELGKRFAAKLLHAGQLRDARVVDRLRLEAQSLGRLRHPNVVGITGFERTPAGLPFIVMELLKGRTLADELAARRHLPLLEALDWASQILSALEAAHAIGIVHRDLCPSNVFLHQAPTGALVPKLLDFGAAQVQVGFSESSPPPLAVPTQTGSFVGAQQFRSPENAQGRPTDARTDIYQFGLILYLMLTGRGPFDDWDNDPRLDPAQAPSPPEPPSRHVAAGLPKELDSLVLTALAFRAEDRFQTAAALQDKLCELKVSMLPGRERPGQSQALPRNNALPRNQETLPLAPPDTGPSILSRTFLFFGLVALAAMLVLGISYLLGIRR